MKQVSVALAVAAVVSLAAGGCTSYQTRVKNTPGRPTVYEDPGTPGVIQGIGIESQDLISASDEMVRDMLANPQLAGRATPPRVVIDAEYFINEGSSRINKKLIADRLRINLNRAAGSRMVFLARHRMDMVAAERQAKRSGEVDAGTIEQKVAPAGADYRLGGSIKTLDAVDARSGLTSRYHQIDFEMIDLESSVIVWSNQYEFKKTAQDDISYR